MHHRAHNLISLGHTYSNQIRTTITLKQYHVHIKIYDKDTSVTYNIVGAKPWFPKSFYIEKGYLGRYIYLS